MCEPMSSFGPMARTHYGSRQPTMMVARSQVSSSPIKWKRYVLLVYPALKYYTLSRAARFFIFFTDRPTFDTRLYLSLSVPEASREPSLFTDACCFYLARWLVARLRPFILAGELHLRLFKSRIMFPAFVRNTRMQTFEYERRRSVSRLIPFADTVQLRGVRSPVPMHLSSLQAQTQRKIWWNYLNLSRNNPFNNQSSYIVLATK